MPIIDMYANSTDVFGFDPALALRYAAELYAQGKWGDAKLLCCEISITHPTHPGALNLLATIAFQEGDYEGALDVLRRVVRLSGNRAVAYFNMGVALRELGRSDEEIAAYDQALVLHPGFFEALFNRGTALHAMGRHGDALASFDEAIAIRPECAEAFNNRGNALGDLHRYDEALASFDHALRLKPDYAQAYNNRGNALEALGRYEEALWSYQRAQRLARLSG